MAIKRNQKEAAKAPLDQDSSVEAVKAPAGEVEASAADAAEAIAPEEKSEASEAEEGVAMVKVQNLTNTYFLQASTGIRIKAKEARLMADDSWLFLQIRAGILKKVK